MSSQHSQPDSNSVPCEKESFFSVLRWLRISLMVSLMIVGAWITIPLPFSPVPLTLQLVIVLLCPFILGSSGAVTAILLYLFMGVLGFPVFSGMHGGLHMLVGPTGGYLFGFLIAMPLMGALSKRNMLFSLIMGLLIIYACGVSYLAILTQISFSKALLLGFVPYLPLDILKILLVRLLLLKYKKVLTMECSLDEGAHE
jgi:biotin transport system substrate-specific component